MNSSHRKVLTSLASLPVKEFKTHSQKVNPGDVFVCRQGLTWDSHLSAQDAVERGACGVIANRPLDLSVPCMVTPSHSTSVSLINQYYAYPQDQIKHIGVTGTNGKTTVAYCLNQLLNLRGKSAYTGTLGSSFDDVYYPLDNTTPDAITLLNLFHAMEKCGASHHVMEVSSHALSQDRVTHIDFDIVIITNIGSDHLDYHKHREDYIQAKLRLIDRLKPGGVAIVNLDDEQSLSVIERCRSRCEVISFSCVDEGADLFASKVLSTCSGSQFTLNYQGTEYQVTSSLPFLFNVENSLAIIASMLGLGMPIKEVLGLLELMQPAPGRSEVYPLSNGATVILDYAHNYDSLSNLYRNVLEHKTGKVVTVIGVTGERLADADDIGELCFEHSDQLVLTTDNPLGVNQEDLFMALTSKLPLNSNKASACIEDRLLAIKVAITEIQSGDVLLLCGKGHEKYQYITSNKNDAKPYVGDLDALKIAVEAIGLQVVSGLAESEEPADLTVK
ncbi:UDP-N-acetylmuramoyl-L-alanyl-D-glutamate--2,6-diaminopimelate ligase [Photobacterium rosenbergii]|uniref:UDP-N-acetylmuramoyl-L-alanyl-D-glutamate--2, 6-diaminopimelate ligase n=1 Tax=Photobacterium rosenbergii TaxID=294936 RepID=A0A2T3NL14_9GAMM|nr:UDP-N-acetylmuramoyl-L-alanyl-D-glutamate--2,6-diaminopimelate ligase [Photobacterium rosenbergii]PSW16170.1 UDP-N-acetylmuramoyl-L-alanyl-D-glutamate--2,6-diaminopimelate ligase [Photobacterium rosenbergii]